MEWKINWALDHYGVLSKLIFNESSVKNSEGILRTLGFVHLYTASGIHLYALLDAIERSLYRISQWMGFRSLILKRIGFFAGLALLGYLWSLQEYRLGFARPILIFLIRTYVRELGLRWRLFYPLSITFLLDYLLKIESGRVHYYLAVGGGLLGLEAMKDQKKSIWHEHAAMALGSWVFTAVIDLCTTHQIAWMTPVWSLLTIPLISLIFYPVTIGCLIATHSIPDWIFHAWNALLDVSVRIIDLGLTFSVVDSNSIAMGGVFACMAWAAMGKVKDLKRLGMLLVLLVMTATSIRVFDAKWIVEPRVVQFDVKQGDSAMVRKNDRVEVVDVGSSRALRPDQWLQKFSRYGLNHVDVVLFTHLDEDHVGGILNLLAWVPIDLIQTHQKHWQSEKGEKWISRIRERSEVVVTSKNHLQLMHLDWFQTTSTKKDGNGFMAGIVAPIDQNRAYFALGDGDDSQERLYLKRFSEELNAYPIKFWKAGHHGSRFSSGYEEMKSLNPSQVWVSVGKKNRYHHPSVEMMSRMANLHFKVQRTDELGDLVE